MKYNRVFLIILDSLGIGEAKDADRFNDVGANTFRSLIKVNEFKNLKELGIYNLLYNTFEETNSYYMKGLPFTNGKDTLTGHLEIMGINTQVPFKTFTDTGFPKELIDELEKRSGRGIIGNCSASGTEIIAELGEEHMKTGKIIVYTSADSVLQIAAHEEVVPLEELYNICQIARELTLKEEWKVGRIIARPFIGTPGNFTRTSNRHDYALDPSSKTVLDNLKDNGYDVLSIGKINDIYNGCGITDSVRTSDNLDGINKVLDATLKDFKGLCFANLNDFDSKYGHRRNIEGYSNCLLEFDNYLPNILNNLKEDDLLIITADHGNDPSYRGTDHTRENVPVLIYSKSFTENGRLEDLNTFADIGATIADNFNVNTSEIGTSFLDKLK